jgi:hypothetical protein
MAAMLLVACGRQEVETPPPAAEAAATGVQAPSDIADSVYTTGKIYTVNEAQP